MARPVILGNGSLTIGLNELGLVNDFYYPYVGLDNLTTARSGHHKVGVWIDGEFSWVDDGSWSVDVDFEEDALISKIKMTNDRLGVSLLFRDFVEPNQNIFFRKVTIQNHHNQARSIRLFMHQVFEISRGGRADTGLYVPDEHYILDYKGRCCLLIYGQDEDGNGYDQFAIGNYGIEGKEGTYKDAEDGELSGSAVEHGGVDSVIRFNLDVAEHSEKSVHYWIVASDSQFSAEKIHLQVKKSGLEQMLADTSQHWHEWLGSGANALHRVDGKYLTMTKKSLMMLKVHTDRRGGVIASCDSSIYNYGRDYYSYVWPRDGAYVMWPLIRLGFTEEPRKFFEFCRDIMTPEGYLMHKYQPDGAIGSTWHPLLHGKHQELAIQEDETSCVLYMLGEYLRYSGDKEFVHSLYDTFIQPAANFMTDFFDDQTGLPHATYDLWEEKFLTTTYTTATVYQALLVAAEFAEMFQYPDDAVRWKAAADRILDNSAVFFDEDRRAFRKGFLLKHDGSLEFDNVIDVSSFYGVIMYGLHGQDTSKIKEAINTIENVLLDQSPSKGSPRYENDNYFKSDPPHLGNPWFVTTLWLAQYYARSGSVDKARSYIEWALERALPSGVMSEQVNPETNQAISVTPLAWSHAEFINTVLDISSPHKSIAVD